jgi:hypothetical protein
VPASGRSPVKQYWTTEPWQSPAPVTAPQPAIPELEVDEELEVVGLVVPDEVEDEDELAGLVVPDDVDVEVEAGVVVPDEVDVEGLVVPDAVVAVVWVPEEPLLLLVELAAVVLPLLPPMEVEVLDEPEPEPEQPTANREAASRPNWSRMVSS